MSIPTLQEIVNSQSFDQGFREVWAEIKSGAPIDEVAFGLTQRRPMHPTEEYSHLMRGKWAAIKEARKEQN